MSSMVRTSFVVALFASALTTSVPVTAQQAHEWDNARANLVAQAPGPMASAVVRWEQLTATPSLGFYDYANFLMQYPGFPLEDRIRGYAEARLQNEFVPPEQVIAFFDRFQPVGNPGRGHYALALMARRPDAAPEIARAAWRGGAMSDTASATIFAAYGNQFTADDHDARMDALLWQRDRAAAERQLFYASPQRREVFQARLAILQGGDGATLAADARTDPGYLYNRSRELRLESRPGEAVALLANRPPLAALPFNPTAWVEEQLNVARIASAREAQIIAARIDEAFAPGTDISAQPYKLRDDYTSLVWLGGTKALWESRDAAAAAPLFYRYGMAARTPPTRSKGFFWAGHAASQAGNAADAQRYYEMAAVYPDRFYGQLALERLGRPLPQFPELPNVAVSDESRAAFRAAPLTQAVGEVARSSPWSTGIRFYQAVAAEAVTLEDHLLVAELARELGRRDLAVNLHDAAGADGHDSFTRFGFPTLASPPGTNWTMVHAIARQESQFAQDAISHAGARGLMQLMPPTAREEAEKAGIAYLQASLIDDASYNVRLGSNHIERLLGRYNGSYPLAIAAYNAGPGNVNRWLRENGDPRTGAISWIDWIEKIPFFETKTYVTRVIENAVIYEALYPDLASTRRSRGVSEFLR